VVYFKKDGGKKNFPGEGIPRKRGNRMVETRKGRVVKGDEEKDADWR
jgi:hypothetical protein